MTGQQLYEMYCKAFTLNGYYGPLPPVWEHLEYSTRDTFSNMAVDVSKVIEKEARNAYHQGIDQGKSEHLTLDQ